MKKIILLFILTSQLVLAQHTSILNDINAVTKDKKATVAVSVLGIENDFQFSNANGNLKMPMMSVFKFHIALAVLNQVDRGNLALDQKVLVKKSDLLENTWSPIREKYPDGNVELPLSEIITYTVAQSDNNGCDILLRLIGGVKTVQKLMDVNGVKNFQVKYNEEEMSKKGVQAPYANYTTTASMVKTLKAFYKGMFLSKRSTIFLMDIMTKTNTGMSKLPGLLPKVRMARKTGSSGKMKNGLTIAENDSGIVTLANGKHYAIAVFVKDSMESEEVNCGMIAQVSKIVWDALNKKNKP
ncbi:CME family extended-spectrum class A beta-lactamase [Elizabethkingia anophelis]|uniref:CME family extended-spectrum class A beta-lactamase n=1 Tax=Elizabethkingia anophelis TaxID=1117645 RepID=UPI00077E88C9|nr:CME family extended-spectrum class A beta-lactamase [Elizabethkingia anophelis]AMR40201.1 class A beta-lactamase [Elizabethkingia anophelis]AMX46834.1 class A beta-lactamase [Elizabethkingia anophelis]AMX50298.1 class A beta-lactamase [Elizabethkingia anophelis]AMX53686.1 class A beta-lactamase [Elizabethkingia anophelis]EGT4346167.1 CME family class A extended-spectrum beta-lactamase [Elizabethkingia anophelis]